ncbi:MAG: YbhB/YbcL family Raf kinase inhibitor-like protein [Candidatus Omnitrophota bacterium]
MEIKSPAFAENEVIPKKYTCQGEDISPQLEWDAAPVGTKSFALICDDPDAPAGTWTHWTLFNIPADKNGLEEGFGITRKEFADGIRQGQTDFGGVGYHGPCPPPGKFHRYFFKLYALDILLELPAGVARENLEVAIQGHILAEAQVMGRYKR